MLANDGFVQGLGALARRGRGERTAGSDALASPPERQLCQRPRPKSLRGGERQVLEQAVIPSAQPERLALVASCRRQHG